MFSFSIYLIENKFRIEIEGTRRNLSTSELSSAKLTVFVLIKL